MSKVNKEILKGLIKECLVEIFSEGFLPKMQQQVASKKVSPPSQKRPKTIFDQLDEVKNKNSGKRSTQISHNDSVSYAVKSATSDPILQSILADTARTTLQEQLQHDRSIPKVPQIDPTSFYAPAHEPPRQKQKFAESKVHNEIFSPVQEDVPHTAAAGLDIASLFGDATRNWGEVLERADKKLP